MPTDPYSGNAASFPAEIDLPNDNTEKSAASVAVPLAQLADRTMALVPRIVQVGVTLGFADYGTVYEYVKATRAPGAVLFTFIIVGGGGAGDNVGGGSGGGGGGGGEIVQFTVPASQVPDTFDMYAGPGTSTPGGGGTASYVSDSANLSVEAAGGVGASGATGGAGGGRTGGAGGNGGTSTGLAGQRAIGSGASPGVGATNGPGDGGKGWGAGGGGGGDGDDGGGGGAGGWGSGHGVPTAAPGTNLGGESNPGTVVVIAWCSAHA